MIGSFSTNAAIIPIGIRITHIVTASHFSPNFVSPPAQNTPAITAKSISPETAPVNTASLKSLSPYSLARCIKAFFCFRDHFQLCSHLFIDFRQIADRLFVLRTNCTIHIFFVNISSFLQKKIARLTHH